MSELLAFDVEINSMHGIAFAATKPKARWIAVKSYWDAGYGRKGLWPRPVAVRAPRFDQYAQTIADHNKLYSEDYLR